MPAGAVQTLDESKPDRVAAIVKTTGTVLLARCAARAEATSPVAAMATTPMATSSAASAGSAS